MKAKKSGLLCWDKPEKVRSTKEHNDMFVSDGAPPGTYVPNMSDEDKLKWKAKKIGGKDPRVEIRKTTFGRWCPARSRWEGRAQALLVVRWPKVGSATVTISSNGKVEFDLTELKEAIEEASEALL